MMNKSLMTQAERTKTEVGRWILTVYYSPNYCDVCEERIPDGCASVVYMPKNSQYILVCLSCYNKHYKKEFDERGAY